MTLGEARSPIAVPRLHTRAVSRSIAGLCSVLLCAGCSEPDRRAIPPEAYRAPAQLDDGWTTGTPAELGLRDAPLQRMSEAIRRGDYPNVHAVLIAKNGRLVYEDYFEGEDFRFRGEDRHPVSIAFGRDTLHDIRSIAKALTSAVVGIALDAGAIPSLDAALVDFFPDYASSASAGTERITLRHALTMTGGIEWNEMDLPQSDTTNDDVRMEASEDPAAMILGRRVVSDPGSEWYYTGGMALLLGMVVSRATEQPFGFHVRDKLFEPMEFGPLEWAGPPAWTDIPEMRWDGSPVWSRSANPSGETWLRPRDLLKFGSLYLNGGRWHGTSIIPADWVEQTLERKVWRGAPAEHGEGVSSRGGYGYLWMYTEYSLPYGEVKVHSADGNGGQRIWLVPELDLAAVHLTGNYNLPWAAYQADRLLVERIVPWALGIDADYGHEISRPTRPLAPGELEVVELSAAERARYVGVYEEPGARLEVRDDNGTLRLVLPGAGTVELFPQGDHVFAMGRRGPDGTPDKLFWPDERTVFVLDEAGAVAGYEYRDANDGRVWGEGRRVP